MDYNDRQAIEGLFGKLSRVESQSGPRDPEAENFIRDRIAHQPGAPYFMAQTIVVQEQALTEAQRRIEELEYQLASRPASGGGFLSGLFGSNQPARPAPRPVQPQGYGAAQAYAAPQAPAAGPWGNQGQGNGFGQAQGYAPQGQAFAQQPSRGSGFLAGAAQTAMGVAGGMLLGNAIAGMFSGNEAQAAESGNEESGADDGGMEDLEF
ncbi:DUF2076 domain-containing protein [Rhizobium oryzicola]|uniref:DUF2076 domain-containing protein n=1 Tax=Rhizobium oryzicola TaxID=1232668 RepID=A0ABT8T4C4_9HYPH|nr:DUF2076 domain-containing protein [Rhizobium oryzicola]MDO1585153.1 DUF2076 domain-containing protein [Rhizobium oryzicola]